MGQNHRLRELPLAEEFHKGCDPRSLTMDPLSWAGDRVEPAFSGESSHAPHPQNVEQGQPPRN